MLLLTYIKDCVRVHTKYLRFRFMVEDIFCEPPLTCFLIEGRDVMPCLFHDTHDLVEGYAMFPIGKSSV